MPSGFDGVDNAVGISGNAFAAEHGSIVSGRERWRGVRPVGDGLPCLLCPVDEREADSWFLCLVPAHGVELGDGFGMLPLGQSHAVREARKRA